MRTVVDRQARTERRETRHARVHLTKGPAGVTRPPFPGTTCCFRVRTPRRWRVAAVCVSPVRVPWRGRIFEIRPRSFLVALDVIKAHVRACMTATLPT